MARKLATASDGWNAVAVGAAGRPGSALKALERTERGQRGARRLRQARQRLPRHRDRSVCGGTELGHRTKTTPCANDRHPLFDHLIGGCEQRLRNAQTKRSRGGVMAADGPASHKLRKTLQSARI